MKSRVCMTSVLVLTAGIHGCGPDCPNGKTKGLYPSCITSGGESESSSEATTEISTEGTTLTTSSTGGGLCGNEVKEDGEDCDDGNMNENDGCLMTCQEARCGDGVVCSDKSCAEVEACDDGNEDSTDACVGCAAAECGDGFVWAGKEACDDGNLVDTDDCVGCVAAACGDGFVREGKEACDDGNAVDTDDCVGCAAAWCGDGFVWEGKETCDDGMMNGMAGKCRSDCSGRCGDGVVNGMEEECDDANAVEDDACSNTCEKPRRVFATSGKFDGSLGGLDGAKAKCEAAAMGAGLGGSWEVWLSDEGGSPSTRFDTSFGGVYKLVGKETVVAKGWAGLTSGSLLAAIDADEQGKALVDPKSVWSNTTTMGGKAGVSCENWTSAAFNDQIKGRVGVAEKVTGEWTDAMAMNPTNCSNSFHLYCFEDP